MDASTVLLLIAAVAPYLIWLVRSVIRSLIHDSSQVDHGAINKEEVSTVDSGASSSAPVSCSSVTTKYDVFLSFRGEDTRDNFTSHLYEALCRAKIDTYIDYRLERGGEITPLLLEAIDKSMIFVIILSKDYASSTWCLDELVKIMECKERQGRVVLPVFYNIDPSNVRKQSGSYANAFLKHDKRFKGDKDRVQRWKAALSQAANLSGWDSTKTRPESKLIGEIVKDIMEKLLGTSSCDFDGLVGIHKHVEKMEALLSIGSPDVRIVGIWGMGGIGKTTIADVMFHKLKSQFESFSFVANVREQIARKGMRNLQKKCLSQLLEDEDFDIYDMRSTFVKNRLQRRKVLLVLDDVDNSIEADDLIQASNWFGLGSRIIITSRDMHVIKEAGANETYHVQKMDFHDALQLFSLKAFKENKPPKSYLELSERVVMNHCKGIPLALIVLGSFLYGRSEKEWESTMAKLEKAPKKEIFHVLKISFDGLEDEEKDIFLDLACFFSKGPMSMPYLHNITDYYGFAAYVEIRVLIERSLISVGENGRILMHDLVEAMGKEIVTQQLRKNPEKPIRLWKLEDVYRTLSNNMGLETIRSISMDISKTKKIYLHNATFQRMYNLRFLEFYKPNPWDPSGVHIRGGLENLPDELRILRWEVYPLPSLPLRFCPENLVELNMTDSNLERLWDGDQLLPNLKIINLEGSQRLTELPDLSETCNIEKLILSRCVSLVQLFSSSSLIKLEHLSLSYCDKMRNAGFAAGNCVDVYWGGCPLRSLPQSILSENLVRLLLPFNNLELLWEGEQHLPNLEEIDLDNSMQLTELPDLKQTPNIKWLHLANSPRLVQLYSSSFLYKLKSIDLKGCHKLRSLHLARNIHRRISLLVAVYNYFNPQNFSFIKVEVRLLESNRGNKPIMGCKVVSVPFTELSECIGYGDGVELQLLGKVLASSLPNLITFRWLHIPSSIGEFSDQFDLHLSQESDFGIPYNVTKLELLRKSSKTPEQAMSVMQEPCIKGRTTKGLSSSSLEQLMDSENAMESDFSGFNTLFKVPTNMGYLMFITTLSLQESNIVNLLPAIPSFTSLISQALCDSTWHQPLMDLFISEDTKENESDIGIRYPNQSTYESDIGIRYPNQSTSSLVELYACPTRMMMRMTMVHLEWPIMVPSTS